MSSLENPSFRELLNKWDESKPKMELELKVNDLLDGRNYIFFFEKDKNIFGAPEESRVVFAKMKTPDEELPDNWAKEANFGAHNLSKALHGENTQNIFNVEDLDKIKVLDHEEARKMLLKKRN